MTNAVQYVRLTTSNILNERRGGMKFAVKEAREKKGITQEQLAEQSGVSRATISKLETNGTDVCSSLTLTKLAETLECPVSALFVE